jgi:hypothetical protein
MNYRVRSPEGEMEFPSLYEVAKALRQGLVDAEDQLLSPGESTPIRVGDHPALRGHLPAPAGRGLLGGAARLELGATVAAGLAAITGILSGWNHWVVGGCVVVTAYLSTRIALRAGRRKSARRVDSESK